MELATEAVAQRNIPSLRIKGSKHKYVVFVCMQVNSMLCICRWTFSFLTGCFVSRILGRRSTRDAARHATCGTCGKPLVYVVTLIQALGAPRLGNTAAPAPRPARDARDTRPHPRLSAGGRLKHHYQAPQPVAAKPVPTDHGARRTTPHSGRIGSRFDPILLGRRGCRGSTRGAHRPRRLEHPRSHRPCVSASRSFLR